MKNLIPRFIHDNFKAGNFAGQFEAATMFVDISGFTAMTEALMTYGKEGAEALAATLMAVFDPLINAVYAHGGIVTGFAGDAFTAVFSVERDPKGNNLAKALAHDSNPTEQSLRKVKPLEPYAHALAAGRAIRQNFVENPIRSTKFGVFDFAVKVGLADGAVEWGIIRSAQEPYQHVYYFRGPAIDACAKAEHQAEKGDLIISQTVHDVLNPLIQTETAPHDHYKITKINGSLPPGQTVAAWQADPDAQIAFLPPEIVHAATLGEFRDVLTVFISLNDIRATVQLTDFMRHAFPLLHKYRGTLTHLDFGDKGCNLLIFWGTPVSFENDVERALNFLLDLKNALPTPGPSEEGSSGSGPSEEGSLASPLLGGDSGVGIFRAGVTRRLMYAGYAGGALQGEHTCYGRGVNLAARLMMKADWGEVWLDQAVMQAAQRAFEMELKGQLPFKGFADPQPVWFLKGRTATTRLNVYQGEMIGRETELAQLKKFIQPILGSSADRFAGILYVYGEAGMGKSLLIYQLRQQFKSQTQIHWCYCPGEAILQKSCHPFQAFLRNFFRQANNLSEVENKQRFESRLQSLADDLKNMPPTRTISEIRQELERTQSILAGMIDLSYPGSLYELLEPKQRYESTLFAFKNFIKALSLERPVVLSLDDIQWFDDDSRQMLKILTRRIAGFPIAIICAGRYRDDGSRPALSVDAEVRQNVLDLNYLAANQVRAIAAKILNSPIADDLVNYLTEKTSGNPFFVEQISLNLKEIGALQETDTGLTMGPVKIEDLPSTINAVLISRLDRLSHEVKTVVKTAAVIGREFESVFLMTVIHQLDPDFPMTLFYPALETAARDQVWSSVQEIRYIFTHVLLRDAAYQMQLKARLRQLHGLIAETMAQLNPDDKAYYADIALHYEKAERLEPAKAFYDKAGQAAQDKYALLLADQYVTAALKLCLQLHGENHTETANAYTKMGDICQLQAKYDRALDAYQKALAIRLKLLGEKHPETATSYHNIGNVYDAKGEYDRALDAYQKALAIRLEGLGEKHPDTAMSYHNIGNVYWDKGEYDRALEYFQKALAIRLELLGEKHPATAASYNNIGNVYKHKGEYDRALDYYQKALAIQLELLGEKHPATAASYNNIGNVYKHKGEYDRALDYYQKALAIRLELLGEKHPDTAASYNNIGTVYGQKGEYDRSLEYFQKALAIWLEGLGEKHPDTARSYNNIGLVYAHKGQYDQALDYYQKALAIRLELLGEKHPDTAASYNGIGDVYSAKGEYDQAQDYHQKALAIKLELLGEKHPDTAASYNGIGDVYKEKGEYDRALEYLHKALAIWIETGVKGYVGYPLSSLAHVYFYLQDDEKALATALRHLQHIREIGADVEHGYTHLAIALVLARPNRFPKPVRSLLDEITALTGLPETPAAYFEKAIETAAAKNYLETLVPALSEYGRYRYQSGQPEAGLAHLRQAKEKAGAGGMQGEVRKIEKIFEELKVKSFS